MTENQKLREAAQRAADFLLLLPSNDGYDDARYECIESLTEALALPTTEPVEGGDVPLAWRSTRDGLLAYVLQEDLHNRLTPRVIDIAYSAFMSGAVGKNNEDGGKCDWFNDTKPTVMEAIEKIRRDMDSAKPTAQAQEPSKLTHCTCDEVSCGTAICGHAPKAQALPGELALPPLPDAFALSISVHDGEHCKWPLLECQLLQKHPNEKQKLYTADQMRDYARAALAAKPVPDDVRKDAERYRWLADCNNYPEAVTLISNGSLTADALGKAIDAATLVRGEGDPLTRYRVWPDGTVQEGAESPYAWMSDDFEYVDATDEEQAVLSAAMRKGKP